MTTSSISKMFSVRIVTVDHYLSQPVPQLDVTYSEFRGSSIKQVPVIRIFGTSETGEKTCVHIHGVFPYICVPYDGSENFGKLSHQLAVSLDKAINIALGYSSSNTQHVYKVILVSGIPFYGYHKNKHQFLKIYFYKPSFVKQAITLLQNGAILNKVFQPHEAHVPFILQFFIDFNLYGMSFIQFQEVKFRKTDYPDYLSNIPEECLLPENIAPAMSVSRLEVDAMASHILNRTLNPANGRITNPGLAAIWEDERKRSSLNGSPSRLKLLHSQRPVHSPTPSDKFFRARLAEALESQTESEDDSTFSGDSVQNTLVAYPVEAPPDSNELDASFVTLHISPPVAQQSSNTTEQGEKDVDVTLVDEDVALSLSHSQRCLSQALERSNIMDAEDLELIDILEDLAHGEISVVESNSILGSQKSGNSQTIQALHVAPAEESCDSEEEDCHWMDKTLSAEDEMQKLLDLTLPGIDQIDLNIEPQPGPSGLNQHSLDLVEYESTQEDRIPQIDGADDIPRKPIRKSLGVRSGAIRKAMPIMQLNKKDLKEKEDTAVDRFVVSICELPPMIEPERDDSSKLKVLSSCHENVVPSFKEGGGESPAIHLIQDDEKVILFSRDICDEECCKAYLDKDSSKACGLMITENDNVAFEPVPQSVTEDISLCPVPNPALNTESVFDQSFTHEDGMLNNITPKVACCESSDLCKTGFSDEESEQTHQYDIAENEPLDKEMTDSMKDDDSDQDSDQDSVLRGDPSLYSNSTYEPEWLSDLISEQVCKTNSEGVSSSPVANQGAQSSNSSLNSSIRRSSRLAQKTKLCDQETETSNKAVEESPNLNVGDVPEDGTDLSSSWSPCSCHDITGIPGFTSSVYCDIRESLGSAYPSNVDALISDVEMRRLSGALRDGHMDVILQSSTMDSDSVPAVSRRDELLNILESQVVECQGTCSKARKKKSKQVLESDPVTDELLHRGLKPLPGPPRFNKGKDMQLAAKYFKVSPSRVRKTMLSSSTVHAEVAKKIASKEIRKRRKMKLSLSYRKKNHVKPHSDPSLVNVPSRKKRGSSKNVPQTGSSLPQEYSPSQMQNCYVLLETLGRQNIYNLCRKHKVKLLDKTPLGIRARKSSSTFQDGISVPERKNDAKMCSEVLPQVLKAEPLSKGESSKKRAATWHGASLKDANKKVHLGKVKKTHEKRKHWKRKALNSIADSSCAKPEMNKSPVKKQPSPIQLSELLATDNQEVIVKRGCTGLDMPLLTDDLPLEELPNSKTLHKSEDSVMDVAPSTQAIPSFSPEVCNNVDQSHCPIADMALSTRGSCAEVFNDGKDVGECLRSGSAVDMDVGSSSSPSVYNAIIFKDICNEDLCSEEGEASPGISLNASDNLQTSVDVSHAQSCFMKPLKDTVNDLRSSALDKLRLQPIMCVDGATVESSSSESSGSSLQPKEVGPSSPHDKPQTFVDFPVHEKHWFCQQFQPWISLWSPSNSPLQNMPMFSPPRPDSPDNVTAVSLRSPIANSCMGTVSLPEREGQSEPSSQDLFSCSGDSRESEYAVNDQLFLGVSPSRTYQESDVKLSTDISGTFSQDVQKSSESKFCKKSSESSKIQCGQRNLSPSNSHYDTDIQLSSDDSGTDIVPSFESQDAKESCESPKIPHGQRVISPATMHIDEDIDVCGTASQDIKGSSASLEFQCGQRSLSSSNDDTDANCGFASQEAKGSSASSQIQCGQRSVSPSTSHDTNLNSGTKSQDTKESNPSPEFQCGPRDISLFTSHGDTDIKHSSDACGTTSQDSKESSASPMFQCGQRIKDSLSLSNRYGSNASRKCNVFSPVLRPPSSSEVKMSLPALNIPEVVNRIPYYSLYSDVKGKVEIGGNLLELTSHKCIHLDEFRSNIIDLMGLNKQQKRLFQQMWALSQVQENINQLIMSHASDKDVIIAPVKKPPTVHEVKVWEAARKILQCRMKDQEPTSDQQKETESQDHTNDSHVVANSSMNIVNRSHQASTPNTSKISSKVANSPLASPVLTPILQSSLPSNRRLHKRLKSRKCLGKSFIKSHLPDIIENGEDPTSKISVGDAPRTSEEYSSGNLVAEANVSIQRLLIDSQFQKDAISPIMRNVADASACQIKGPAKSSPGYKLVLEKLKDARSDIENQYTTLLSLELHIRTCGSLRPDPERDPIRAVFYYVGNDVPENSNIPLSATGVIVANDPESSIPLLSKSGVTGNITYTADERCLLQETIDLVRLWDPDILAGYEIEMLSWGYLIQRAHALGVNISQELSRVPKQKPISTLDDDLEDNNGLCAPKLAGRILLDVWRLLRSELALQSYTFESVMYHILHERISNHSFEVLSKWWEHPSHLYRWITYEYYKLRVSGVVRILEQLDIIGRTSELARLFGIQFFEVLSRGSQFRVESMMLRLAKPHNYVPLSPSVQQRAQMRAPETVPLIMEPESRFYSDPVIVLDFQSLYPSIIIAYNYCFSTCVGRSEFLGRSSSFEFGCSNLRISKASLRNFKDRLSFSPCGVAFVSSSVRRGILPSMLEEILEARLAVKQSMKQCKANHTLQRLLHARQLGLKLIANVTYGYTAANFSGRMPCIEVGDSVVSKGRETLERAIALVNNNKNWRARVVYGDTDSLFVLVPGRNREEAFRIGAEIAAAVTQDNPSPVKLKLEKVYHPCILQTKKRYVGYMYESQDQKNPVYEAKGIETVRRDGCPAVAKILEQSLKLLFEKYDVSLVKRYVCHQFSKLVAGRANIQDLIYAREYRGMANYRPGACVPALELTRKWLKTDRRAEPRVGERVPYVVVSGPPGQALIHLVRHPHELLADRSLRYNAVYYVTRAIIPPLARCFALLGADVPSWFAELPRQHLTLLPAPTSSGVKKTISQYFSTLECACCGVLTHGGVCTKCLSKPQTLVTSLLDKAHIFEASYLSITKVCQSCLGRSDPLDCISLDCPISYRRHQASQQLQQSTYFHQLLDGYLDL